MSPHAPCALCASEHARPSWLGTTLYDGQTFTYLECVTCGSLFCDPMPDAATLSKMYGPAYGTGGGDDAIEDPKEPRRVVEWLRAAAPGTFIDYGCGGGALLADVQRIGWTAQGVEFDPGVAASVERRIGVRVFDRLSWTELQNGPGADVLHLGDVLEHLTAPAADLRGILRLVKPGGYLLAQGPLEAHPTLFTWTLRTWRGLRHAPPAEMPPYHVTLATAMGQQAMFARSGLDTVQFSMHEVDWPAPSTLAWADLRQPRRLGLYGLRRLSRAVTAMAGGRLGNRYFYVGRRPEAAAHDHAA